MSANELERLRKRVSPPAPVTTAPAEEVGFDGRDLSGLQPRDVLRVQRSAGNQAVARMVTQTQQRLIQRVPIDGVDVDKTGMASWEWDGKKYHLNLLPDDFHITEEGRDPKKKKSPVTKTHYFFTTHLGADLKWTMKDAIGHGGVSGSKKKFSQLPESLQKWVAKNWDALT
jgi:hypothetical protein